MKIPRITFAVIAVIIGIAHAAVAQTIISDQFTVYNDHHITSGSAGVVAAATWNLTGTDPGNNANNNISQSITQSNLVTSTGSATSVGLTLTFDATYQGNSSISDGADTTNDNLLLYPVYFNRYSNDTPVQIPDLSLQLTGLTSSDNYDLYFYINSPNFGNGSAATVSLVGGPSYSVTTDDTLTNFVQITGSNADGNYVEFTNLTGTNSQTVTVSTGFVGITGFQVVDLGAAVPEPATYAMVLGGFGIFFVMRRMRGKNKIEA